MSKHKFNESMDLYLSSKRKKDNSKRFRHRIKTMFEKGPDRKMSDEESKTLDEGKVHVIDKKEPFYSKMFSKEDKNFNKEEEEIEEELESSPRFSERITSFFSNMFRKPFTPQQAENVEAEEIVEEIHELDDEEERLMQESEELHEKKEGLLRRLRKAFQQKEEVEEKEEVIPPEEYEDLQSDLKEIARFSVNIIKKLPKRKVEDLKESEQFERFKEILKKRNMIRE